jgi:2-polyprenyl-3-methyl-5-hydroxy-6-metoxy-1,4-benzoquinol methylase
LKKIENYLEIAPGHGLFTVEVMLKFPEIKATLLDISETSLRVTGQVLAAFGVDTSQYRLINGDFMTVPVDGHNFDFISMGEVLEHVNDPKKFLDQAFCLLSSQGTIFMSTCANCPAIDHVYHFRNADEIRSLIKNAGFSIVSERSLIIENVPPEGCYKDLIPLNYCAILKKESDKTI